MHVISGPKDEFVTSARYQDRDVQVRVLIASRAV